MKMKRIGQEEREGNKVSKRCCRISRTLVCSMNKVLNYPATGITIHFGQLLRRITTLYFACAECKKWCTVPYSSTCGIARGHKVTYKNTIDAMTSLVAHYSF